MCVDEKSHRIVQVSANLESVLGLPVDTVLGAFLFDVLAQQSTRMESGPSFQGMIDELNTLSEERPLVVHEIRWSVDGVVKVFQLSAWRDDHYVVIEMEPVPRLRQRRILARINQWLARLAEAETRQELLDTLVGGIRQLVGHDRVMVYQFDRDWHGTVVAESCAEGTTSFLYHHFPATDIPEQVRNLYSVNPVRSIPDATAKPVPLLSCDPLARQPPLDLSPGMLRAVSPVHLTYLANMGVGASLSLSIHSTDGLWGLVACHARQPTPLSPALRDAALTLVRMATQRLFLLQEREDARYARRVLENRMLLVDHPGEMVKPDQLIDEYGERWMSLFNADGVALMYQKKLSHVGLTPPPEALLRIVNHLNDEHHGNAPWSSDCLNETVLMDVGKLADLAGMLALPLTAVSPPGWLLFFREEQQHVRYWAGSPEAEPVVVEGRAVINPRRSFDRWEEQVAGHSPPWRSIEIRLARELSENISITMFIHQVDMLNERLRKTNQYLASLATTDSLTDTWNRYRIEQELEKEVAVARRYTRPCTLLLFDIDNFKRFNDVHGHEAGDRVLKVIAHEVTGCLRESDNLGRWGGEEFIVLAANSTLDDGAQLAERLRLHVEALDFGELGVVTISVGVAEWRKGDTRKALVARADEAMYRAKNSGRNCVKY
ncbi:diguanylate cyclase [Porticoccus sp.]|uniref:sensor domain-containing diguanylate cyclase n=1 Tax=Porticoccus sp. TaxID=2024853 RepID=UPI003F69D231